MRINKIMIACIFVLAIFTLSAVSAADNSTDTTPLPDGQDNVTSDQKENLSVEIICDEKIVPDSQESPKGIAFKNVPDDYSEKIELSIDGEIKATAQAGELELLLNLRDYSIGNHTILAKLPETQKYNALTLTKKFEVTRGYLEIDDRISDATKGVRIALQEKSSGELIVNVDGKLFKKVQIGEDTTSRLVSLIGLTKGKHTIEATYTGSPYNLHKKKTVTVQPDVEILLELPDKYLHGEVPDNAYGSDRNIIEIELSADASKAPTVMVENQHLTVKKIADNIYQVNVSNINPGIHTINVTYPGDAKYPAKTVLKDFEVAAAIGINNPTYGYFYNATDITLKLPDDAKGNLSVYINDNLFDTRPVENGIAEISLDGVKVGRYRFAANYTGSDYNVENRTYDFIEIIPHMTCPEEMTYGENKSCTVEFNPDLNLTVRLRINNDEFDLPIVDGKGSFSLSGLLPISMSEEHYYYDVTFLFNGTYHNMASFTLMVHPVPSKLIGAKDITMYYGDSKAFTLKVSGDLGKIVGAGETVKVKIGTKTYYPKTDKNGMISLKISELPGSYKIIASYHDATVTKKLAVKHVVALKSVTVKRSAKKLVLTATLKNAKALKNKQVTFKFNGKTYKAKTNSKGIAKVTVKSSVLKKLKVGKTVTYQATYLKDTVKKTAKVKK